MVWMVGDIVSTAIQWENYGKMMINYGIWCRSAIFRDTQVKLFYDRIPCWVMGHKWSKITSFLGEGRTKNQAPIYGQWGTRTLETKLSCSHQNSSYCWTFILPNVGTSIGRSRHTLSNFDPFLCMTSQVDILELEEATDWDLVTSRKWMIPLQIRELSIFASTKIWSFD